MKKYFFLVLGFMLFGSINVFAVNAACTGSLMRQYHCHRFIESNYSGALMNVDLQSVDMIIYDRHCHAQKLFAPGFTGWCDAPSPIYYWVVFKNGTKYFFGIGDIKSKYDDYHDFLNLHPEFLNKN